ncbi:MAG TPA: RhuM family protein [Bacteroidales bacterium]|jgi:hypothetical protein|nr:RhuM family protein [Bacteroidales bacterium]HPS71995.1 RhuM family protein [Bacteroidales bacterium]
MKDEIIIYRANEETSHIEVRIEDETVWLTQAQIVDLFDSSKTNISEHLKNIFHSKELDEVSVVRKIRTTASDGKMYEMKYYNLDAIISVGYRVNSLRGTQFRIWANKILKDYLLKGQITNYRINNLENDMRFVKTKLNEIDIQLQTNLPPNHGIYFNGQIFDAYVFVSEIIKKAKSEIILIDNYIDETVLILLSKRNPVAKATIYTGKISQQLLLDLDKHNQQYPPIEIKQFTNSHDRFIIIDRAELYHIGASLKDLGKKWFACSRMDSLAESLLNMLKD